MASDRPRTGDASSRWGPVLDTWRRGKLRRAVYLRVLPTPDEHAAGLKTHLLADTETELRRLMADEDARARRLRDERRRAP